MEVLKWKMKYYYINHEVSIFEALFEVPPSFIWDHEGVMGFKLRRGSLYLRGMKFLEGIRTICQLWCPRLWLLSRRSIKVWMIVRVFTKLKTYLVQQWSAPSNSRFDYTMFLLANNTVWFWAIILLEGFDVCWCYHGTESLGVSAFDNASPHGHFQFALSVFDQLVSFCKLILFFFCDSLKIEIVFAAICEIS